MTNRRLCTHVEIKGLEVHLPHAPSFNSVPHAKTIPNALQVETYCKQIPGSVNTLVSGNPVYLSGLPKRSLPAVHLMHSSLLYPQDVQSGP